MLIIRVNGGLGNQMFQYALGTCLAVKNKTQLKVDLTLLLDRSQARLQRLDMRAGDRNIVGNGRDHAIDFVVELGVDILQLRLEVEHLGHRT